MFTRMRQLRFFWPWPYLRSQITLNSNQLMLMSKWMLMSDVKHFNLGNKKWDSTLTIITSAGNPCSRYECVSVVCVWWCPVWNPVSNFLVGHVCCTVEVWGLSGTMKAAQLCFQTYSWIISPARCRRRDEGWRQEVTEGGRESERQRKKMWQSKQRAPLGDHVQNIMECKCVAWAFVHGSSCGNWEAFGCKHWCTLSPLRFMAQIRAGDEMCLSKYCNVSHKATDT